MTVTLSRFDPTEYLDDAEEMAAYLEDALASGDIGVFTDALGVLARAKGMSQLARDTGLSRTALYRSLSENGRPEFLTVVKVMKAVGVTLTATPLASRPSAARNETSDA